MVYRLPHTLIVWFLQAPRPHVIVFKGAHLLRNMGSNMNAIGNGLDGYFIFGQPGPQRLPHLARDLAVKFANAIAIG